MINALIAWSLRNRWAVLVIALGVMLYGAAVAKRMPVDVFPDLTAPTVTVIVEGHGMAPEEMERLVTLPIESSVNGAAQVRRVRSATSVGIAVIWVEFEWGTDIYRARQTVNERLAVVSATLPQDVEPPLLAPISSMMGEILFVGLTSDVHGPLELRQAADTQIVRPLLAVEGVSQCVPIGGDTKQFQVVLSPRLMQDYGLSLQAVHAAIEESNQNTSAGFLIEGGSERLLRGIGRLRNEADVAVIEVEHRDGRSIQVGDLGVVQIGAALKRGTASIATRNEQGEAQIREGVVIAIQKQPTANTLALTDELDQVFVAMQESLPPGMQLQRGLFRQADFIDASVANTTAALVEGAGMVVLVVVVFLASLQASFIALLAIPLSLLAALLVLWAFGVGMNTMTLGGMAIAIGALVDDAIIDVENVLRRLRENRGKEKSEQQPTLRVIYHASAEVRASIVLATCIILLVFTPLFFLSGVEGRLLLPLGIAFCVALAASLLTALTVTPALCALLLPKSRAVREHNEPAMVAGLKRAYAPLLKFALRHPFWVSAPALALFAWSAFEFSRLGKNFLPEFNEGAMVVGVVTLPGTSLEQSDQLARLAEARLIAHPEVVAMARRTGRAEADEHVQGVEASEFEITLDMQAPAQRGLPVRTRAELLAAMRADMEAIPGLQASFGQPISHRVDHMLSGTRASIAVKIFGPELARLRTLAAEAESVMSKVEGVVDLNTEQQIEVPQTRVIFDREALARYGVSLHAASETLQATALGVPATQILEGQQSYEVVVRWAQVAPNSALDLQQLRVRSQSGEWVAMPLIAEIVRDLSPNLISRENVQRKIVVMCNVAGRDVLSVVEDIRAAIDAQLTLPAEYSVEYGGQFETAVAANRRLAVLGGLAVLGIALLLLARFRSIRDVLLIMLNLPLALIGGVVGVILSGGIISIASIIGFVSVFGIAARNGIMLVSHVRHLSEKEGVDDFAEAVFLGSLERLAPILMTAVSAALALIPLAMRGEDPGTEILTPMAIVILYGLISSTVLNMLVVPALLLRFGRTQKPGKFAAAAGVLLAASCVQVQPQPSYEQAAQLIEQHSGESMLRGPGAAALGHAEVQSMLSDGLSLQEARQLSLAFNPRLRARFLEIGAAHADWVQAGLLHNPSLDLVLRWPIDGGSRILEAALGFELSKLWSASTEREVAGFSLDATVLALAQEALVQLSEVELAYYEILQAEELLALKVSAEELHMRRADLLNEGVEAGAIDRQTWLQAQADGQQARLQRDAQEWQVEMARIGLAKRLGWPDDPRALSFDLREAEFALQNVQPSLEQEFDTLLARTLEQRLDLRALELTCQLLQSQVSWEDQQTWAGSTAGLAFESPGGSNELGPTLSLPLPIFDQNQAQVAKATALWQQALLQREAARAEVTQDLRLAWRSFALANEQLAFFSKEVTPLAEEQYALAVEAFEQGRDSIEASLAAELQLIEAREAALGKKWEVTYAALALQRELGHLAPME